MEFSDCWSGFDDLKVARGSTDLKISESAPLSFNHHNFLNTERSSNFFVKWKYFRKRDIRACFSWFLFDRI